MKKFIVELAALALFGAPTAHAAPSWDAICEQLDQGMSRQQVLDGLMSQGMSKSDGLLLINYAVVNNCSEYY